MATSKTDPRPPIDPPPPVAEVPNWLRWVLMGFGLVMVAIGIVGIFVPVLPTTVFLIAALWAFSRSSARFQHWLWHHPTFGPPVRGWHQHRVIGVRAKVLAAIVMSLSFIYILFWVADDWRLPTLVGVILLPAALYVLTRPSRPPGS